MEKIKVALIGFGRTGKKIAKEIINQEPVDLAAVIRSPNGENIGNTVGSVLNKKCDSLIYPATKLSEVLKKIKPDVIIDFSTRKATLKNIKTVVKNRINIVIGTTGFTDKEMKVIKSYVKKIGIVFAINITKGINIMMKIAETIAQMWPKCDFEVIEYHFRKKEDIPSSTALRIAAALRKGRKKVIGGKVNDKGSDVPIHSIRAGGIVGKHQIIFATKAQAITVTHEYISRVAFAYGAVAAAQWMYKRTPGLYTMEEVYNI